MISKITSSGKFWIGMVIGFLMIDVVVFSIAIVLATGDPAHAVEENYYERALNWDETARLRAESEALGWRVRIDGLESTPRGQKSLMRVSISDAEGAPVEGLSVQGVAFHNARSKERVRLAMRPVEAGAYAAAIDASRPGWWEVQIMARRAGERFASTERIFVRPAKAEAGAGG